MLLLAFNWYGYQMVVNFYSSRSANELQLQLDRSEFDELRLVEVRVPLNMPYVGDWDEFETFAGETEINGINYRYVKRKVENGELVLLCIPDRKTTMLKMAGREMFKLVNDIHPGTKKDSKTNHLKPPLADLLSEMEGEDAYTAVNTHEHNRYNTSIPAETLLSLNGKPPES